MSFQLVEQSQATLGLILLRLIHVLGSAAMFGAMFYSITVLQPKARRYFQNAQGFEDFVAFISNGARWRVLTGFALIAISGFALFVARPAGTSRIWTALIVAKITVFLIMATFFCFVSWRLWPARIFATPEEVPRFQRLFRLVGFTMITLVIIEFILSIVAHAM